MCTMIASRQNARSSMVYKTADQTQARDEYIPVEFTCNPLELEPDSLSGDTKLLNRKRFGSSSSENSLIQRKKQAGPEGCGPRYDGRFDGIAAKDMITGSEISHLSQINPRQTWDSKHFQSYNADYKTFGVTVIAAKNPCLIVTLSLSGGSIFGRNVQFHFFKLWETKPWILSDTLANTVQGRCKQGEWRYDQLKTRDYYKYRLVLQHELSTISGTQ
ncbi:hypothetical protein C8F04DRAFT_1177050 [Mycena alexandri]|uniref:Uncharacterized protein n=1 Tax=Mycena alexandri TaxID=1745969 RepID=A0AAD6T9F2_9AGAR|nr:hypothetical protein C8F04DRAFT_1177050 [Mycena alexandri]